MFTVGGVLHPDGLRVVVAGFHTGDGVGLETDAHLIGA
jgi:hypothetical protein